MGYKDIPSLTPTGADVANIILYSVPCTSAVQVGLVVYMNVSNIADLALADTEVNANAIGICEKKISTNICDVRVLGVSGAFYTGLDVTKEYYLSDVTPGELTTTPPTTPGHVVLKMGQPYSDNEFFVLKGIRFIRA